MIEKNSFLRIGTAGWNIPSNLRDHFPLGNSLLERYSQVFNAVEINTSFYRPHRKKTYQGWAEKTPSDFLFSVKIPKKITHEHLLIDVNECLDQFIDEVCCLQAKLGPLLVQLPPRLKFEPKIAYSFFKMFFKSRAF